MAGAAAGSDPKVSSPRQDGERTRDSAPCPAYLRLLSGGGAWCVISLPLPATAAPILDMDGRHSSWLNLPWPYLIMPVLLGVVLVGLLLIRRIRALRMERDAALALAREGAEARARAEAESLAKSRFLTEMSHELRTPLNTVMGFSEMMAQELLGPHHVPAYADYARDIHASGRHLLSLADDLLDLARIESGHRILLETPVRLDHMGQDCLAMMQPAAQRRNLCLTFDVHAVQIWGDERALRQITLNLLTNAVKFTPPGGEVRLQGGIDADGLPHLAVVDTGPGISAGELPLEGAHHRESRLDVTTGRGAGLGLAIVRGLTQLHGGEFTLLSRMGGGTLARVNLPASRLTPLATTSTPVSTTCPSISGQTAQVAS